MHLIEPTNIEEKTKIEENANSNMLIEEFKQSDQFIEQATKFNLTIGDFFQPFLTKVISKVDNINVESVLESLLREQITKISSQINNTELSMSNLDGQQSIIFVSIISISLGGKTSSKKRKAQEKLVCETLQQAKKMQNINEPENACSNIIKFK